jgi:2-aminoethylphosphonate-pyruvate transaminase
MDDDIPYLLLTPGPLTTSRTVRRAMLHDSCTWDRDYNAIVSNVRQRLVELATRREGYTCVLLQGSGTFAVEATLGSVVPPEGKVLIVNNGAYGQRMVQIAERLRIAAVEVRQSETEPADLARVEQNLEADPAISHLALVHCETTTGLLNPVAEVGRVAAGFGKSYIVDAMSSFGGIPSSMEEIGAHYLISSANKCLQGVPGFAFVVAERGSLEKTKGWARSLSLDLYDQWREMEEKGGKWRYTSPTHAVRAFAQALHELDEEGGVTARNRRYHANHRRLVDGMAAMGFRTLLPPERQSPIITAFYYPDDPAFAFEPFYQGLKSRRFVIYPGKISQAETFRIGTIGHVFPDDIAALLKAVAEVVREMGLRLKSPLAPARAFHE